MISGGSFCRPLSHGRKLNYSTSLADDEYPSYCVNSHLLSVGKIEKNLPNKVLNYLILKFNTSAANDQGQNISLHADKYSLTINNTMVACVCVASYPGAQTSGTRLVFALLFGSLSCTVHVPLHTDGIMIQVYLVSCTLHQCC